jgi:aspartate carbamoyltransferase regulatory subunit
MTVRQVATLCGVSPQAALNWANDLGVTISNGMKAAELLKIVSRCKNKDLIFKVRFYALKDYSVLIDGGALIPYDEKLVITIK